MLTKFYQKYKKTVFNFAEVLTNFQEIKLQFKEIGVDMDSILSGIREERGPHSADHYIRLVIENIKSIQNKMVLWIDM